MSGMTEKYAGKLMGSITAGEVRAQELRCEVIALGHKARSLQSSLRHDEEQLRTHGREHLTEEDGIALRCTLAAAHRSLDVVLKALLL